MMQIILIVILWCVALGLGLWNSYSQKKFNQKMREYNSKAKELWDSYYAQAKENDFLFFRAYEEGHVEEAERVTLRRMNLMQEVADKSKALFKEYFGVEV